MREADLSGQREIIVQEKLGPTCRGTYKKNLKTRNFRMRRMLCRTVD